MPTLQCEFWNVGQGLFSSGRIQMGKRPGLSLGLLFASS